MRRRRGARRLVFAPTASEGCDARRPESVEVHLEFRFVTGRGGSRRDCQLSDLVAVVVPEAVFQSGEWAAGEVAADRGGHDGAVGCVFDVGDGVCHEWNPPPPVADRLDTAILLPLVLHHSVVGEQREVLLLVWFGCQFEVAANQLGHERRGSHHRWPFWGWSVQTVGMVPPSMTCSAPTMAEARSETRNATRSATSAGFAGRPSGMPPRESINCPRAASRSTPCPAAMRSTSPSAAEVWMNPGATLLTRTPNGATSLARPLL